MVVVVAVEGVAVLVVAVVVVVAEGVVVWVVAVVFAARVASVSRHHPNTCDSGCALTQCMPGMLL